MKEKMNVLFIITDAQLADHLDCAGLDDFGDIYDRKSDPLELNNLWNDKNFRDVKFDLVNKLLQENLKAQTKNPKRIATT